MAAKKCSLCGKEDHCQDLLIVGTFALWLCEECGKRMLWAAGQFVESFKQKEKKDDLTPGDVNYKARQKEVQE